ncbi:lipopolysaccharide biosynthesis protein [Lactococcus formosensis]|jgi:Membrane protein involved in the export of O-antigen and teichoic acid|uniref:lipopolysaccharide biosynthesis protein n=1 Tax=Lactococcus formosensis TaxID=1281486 RepID=UPI0002DDFBD2|nr:lipopolysaccharide biosynthesis protein [Lactococcus formosensis]NHI72625.1 lipopolysaccharide biosynthesis protein [Lactococcus garvieae]MDG6113168.1 lipopolysaccharide biosynthesis protein [Lactococcus formosensis]MDG6114823.1 lipopolysaccharide biosynthesis protein [Lactococcus formosensis]MDG6120973.1 lipopolysaccharide biosynthesis protein [Lactococcus formosensis]MDG6123895.1 lipopolysaccharide biosynthesis protein [Lactococcus formosensis]
MKNDFKSGIFFTAIAQYSTVVVQLVLNMVLSRLLTPEQIGIVTTVQVLILFFQLLTGTAISPAIVQNKELKDEDYGVIFNYTILIGVIASLFFGIVGGFTLSTIFNNSIYIPICWSMSLIILTSAMNQVPNGILSKEKRFKAISLRLASASVLSGIMGIALAFLHAGIYSLVITFTMIETIILVLNLRLVDIKFTRSMHLEPMKKIFSFVKHQTSFLLLNYFYRNFDNLLVSKFFGAKPLGNYSRSYQLLSLPITVFLSVVNPVLQPILAEHEKNIPLIRDTYLKISQILAFIAIPVSVFFSLNAEPIIYLLFGNQWGGAVVPLKYLSLSIWAQMLAQMMPAIWQARNLVRIQSFNGLVSLGTICISIIVGISFGSIDTVAIAVSISYIINFVISGSLLMTRALEGHLSSIIRNLIKPFLLGILLYAVLYFTQDFTNILNSFVTLLVRGSIWLVLSVVFLYFSGDLKNIKQLVKNNE